METMQGVFVEFMQKAPADVTPADGFLSVKCQTLDEAEHIERRFHAAGWVARVIVLELVRHFPTAGTGLP